MLKYRMTLYDITHKKPAVNIRPGEYYKDFDGYVIRVGSKSRDGRTLRDVLIYDHSRGMNETNVTVAKSGVMQASPDNMYLKFTLFDGYTYSEVSSGDNYVSRPLTSIGFRKQSINFDISSFAYNKSVEENFKGSYQMMNITQLDTSITQLEKSYRERVDLYLGSMRVNLRAWEKYVGADTLLHSTGPTDVRSLLAAKSGRDRRSAYLHARNAATSARQDAAMYEDLLESDREYINRHYIEWHRKFTLSIACLLLFLIGAPFGSIVRKGGLGLPLVASVGFFVLYYVVGMIAEKAVRESALGPEGMWISSLVMLPIGIILTLQATTDSSFFDGSSWRKLFNRLFHRG